MSGMQRSVILIFLVTLLAVGTAAPAWSLSAVGATLGINMSSLSGDAPARVSYNTRPGFLAGLVGEFAIAEDVYLSLQPMYLQKGANISYKLAGASTPTDSLSLRLDYITLPILFKVVANNGKTYVAGGIALAYLLNATLSGGAADEDAGDLVKNFDLAADFAFGVMLPIGRPLLTMELRYQQSILNLATTEESEEGTSLPVRFRNTGFQFLVGVLLPLGGR